MFMQYVDETKSKLAELVEARTALDVMKLQVAEMGDEIMQPVMAQIEALHAEWEPRLQAAEENIAQLEAEVKQMVLSYGVDKLKVPGAIVSYVKGRESVDLEKFKGYIVAHPEAHILLKTGNPTVRITYTGEER